MNEASHWYDPITGEARHTIIGKNNVERPTTLRDARKEGWLPSVTTIFKALAAPELDVWKQQQVLKAAFVMERLPEEPDSEYMKRITEEAFKQVEDAADMGTRIHKALEDYFQGQPHDPELTPYIAPVEKWKSEHQVEFVAHEVRIIEREIGYGGTTDLIIKTPTIPGYGILDFKTRKSKTEYPMKPWQKEPMQIAAYGYAKRKEYDIQYGANVFLSRTEVGRLEDAWYQKDQLDKELEAFRSVVKIWQHFSGYNPSIVDNPSKS